MTPENQPEVVLSDREKYHVPLADIVINNFEEHLSIPSNLRIFFSAKFGTGKSYFLDEFFNKKMVQYEVIKLYPINYSTASTSDIFELIKFDILFHLIMKRQQTISSEIQLPELSKLQAYIHQKFTIDGVDSSLSLITALTSLADGNDIIVKVIPLIIGIYVEEKKKYKENLAKDNLDIADDFMFRINKSFKEYGDDEPITAIIKEALKKLSETKKTVLLIDDLDRLDPDHIFRILNIFGNHFSSSSGNKNYVNENKFGFDKVIFVGDKNNIESIFHHRYGEKADFNGYFNKYYSNNIYKFNVGNKLTRFSQVCFKDLELSHQFYFGDKNNLSQGIELVCTDILIRFLNSELLPFRYISTKRNIKLNVGNDEKKNALFFDHIPYLVFSKLISIVGSKTYLLEIIEAMTDFDIFEAYEGYDFRKWFIDDLIGFTYPEFNIIKNPKTHILKPKKKIVIKIPGFNDTVEYEVHLKLGLNKPSHFNVIEYRSKNLLNPKEIPVKDLNPALSFKKLSIPFINKYF